MEKTYGAAVTELRQASNQLRDGVGGLRDCALLQEKEYYNKIRGLLSQVWDEFVKLEESMSQKRYDEPL